MIKLILFDFDGTIADTLQLVLRLYNLHAEGEGLKKINNLEEVRRLSMKELIDKLRIPMYKIPFWVKKLHPIMSQDIHKAPSFNGIKKTLISLKKNYDLGILSSNSEPTIRKYLKVKEINDCFSFVNGYPRLFGKASAIRKVMIKHNISKEEIIYIGDEVRDIHATKRAGVRIIAVTWGYNAKERIIKEKPDFIADKPSDIPKIIRSIDRL